jgi:hypothetical protein
VEGEGAWKNIQAPSPQLPWLYLIALPLGMLFAAENILMILLRTRFRPLYTLFTFSQLKSSIPALVNFPNFEQ